MLIGKSVQIALLNSKYTYYLTGSKFFGGSNSVSDTDYFVQYLAGVQDELKELGFKQCEHSYIDSQTIEVWHHANDNIHIQLVNGASWKDKAQNFIVNSTAFRKLYLATDQNRRKLLWELAFELTK